ncbi:putative sporulation transcription regulator WhiA [Firmicutes bacterium CAG:194]|nr:putative sporulation transcription regulator WhiA [Firmicutes bacterium CAG:194]HCI17188.1 DNA-binding protein WhiA [Lachnospiraceae bacterium]HCX42073.1 DNA-binding protein WhiA [Lachnospiraceae bacterium]
MSFSGQIKEELAQVISSPRHCQLAELAALVQFCGHIEEDGSLLVQSENPLVIRKCFTLLKKTFKIEAVAKSQMQTQNYRLFVTGEDAFRVLEALKICDTAGHLMMRHLTDPVLIKNSCCKRAYLRGCYMAVGSMSDPYKSYHLELVCGLQAQAEQLLKILHDFSLDAKMIIRKKYHVVYMKEGENIADFLNITEAHKALMEFENTRIYKGMRNMVNRKVNCEAANITKTVNAATRQVEDIRLIREKMGLEGLPEPLRQMAYVRLENPQASLGELGKLLDPPVGKSGVNHRLRKLGELAKELKVK